MSRGENGPPTPSQFLGGPEAAGYIVHCHAAKPRPGIVEAGDVRRPRRDEEGFRNAAHGVVHMGRRIELRAMAS